MLTIETIVERINAAVERIAETGNWPEIIDRRGTLLKRIPQEGAKAAGFDAGIAAALDLIPRDKQKLISTLHAAYSSQAVEQIREESQKMLPHTETCWWLAASSIVTHGSVDEYKFMDQIADFELLRNDPLLRRDVAIEMFTTMIESFKLVHGIPFSIRSRGLQGAYLAGFRFAVQYEEEEGVFYIGTYKESLGLEEFPWLELHDAQGNPT
ncbi:hypothetical protein KKF84_05670, partial [Myxococcota bacterium]|nr:hypothetical protein [Myxococcota bacterium]